MMRGFTILELLIVMLIMGLMVALVGPRMLTAFDSVTRAYTRDDILTQINGLGFQAYRQGRGFILVQWPNPTVSASIFADEETPSPRSSTDLPLTLPEDWHIKAEEPIYFRSNGACNGGELTLDTGDVEIQVTLTAPFCQAQF